MSPAFVQLDRTLEDACRETLVLTPTNRLRRQLLLAYETAQLHRGRGAWLTPRIASLESFLAEQHRTAHAGNADLPRLLGPAAEFRLFRATAPRDGARLVPLAQEAWRIARQWRIPLVPVEFGATERGHAFLHWAERLERRLAAEHAITSAQLPLPGSRLPRGTRLTCVGFEALAPVVRGWLSEQEAAGVEVRMIEPPGTPPAELTRLVFDSPTAELAAAARWARERLAVDPDGARVGIVVPDLGRRQLRVLRQLNAEFDPALSEGLDGLVDVSAGQPLVEQPVWQSANAWLTFCFEGLPAAAVSDCLRQPYLELNPIGVPERLPAELTLADLSRRVPSSRLADLARKLPATSMRRSVQDWLTSFGAALGAVGWGSAVGSVQYQARQRCLECMEALAHGEPDGAETLTAVEALRLLNDYLAGVVFAPERAPAPVQVLGYLETTGLAFTDLWVLGLDDERWPQPPASNPFLPVGTCVRHGVPRSTVAAERQFAEQRLTHWQRGARRLTLSHAGEPERASPLIVRLAPEAAAPVPAPAHPFLRAAPGQLEHVEEALGAPLERVGHLAGGATRLADQAICPFRGYAIHRLRLGEPATPRSLPSASDAGVVTHAALQHLYQDMAARRCTPADLNETDVRAAAQRALGSHYPDLPAPFLQREAGRLAALLLAWNALEQRREGVMIEALEAAAEVDIGGWSLDLRIDRIDRVDGARVVVDYKTGPVGRLQAAERLTEPQLPLYALADESARGVLYAQVDAERPRLWGISDGPVPGARIDPPSDGSWPGQRERWQRQVHTLSDEMAAGAARVDPQQPSHCARCHLGRVCRVALHGSDS